VARIRALNRWIHAHCAASAAARIDYHTLLATPSGALRPEFTEDGIHLNAAGYAAIEPTLLAALVPGDDW
jgi:lysophospholipase L1-like esterase